MKHRMTLATAIPKDVRDKVYTRDRHRCVVCGRYIPHDEETDTYRFGSPTAHYIRRSQGGKGIEENVVTLCFKCHDDFDNGRLRVEIGDWLSEYLEEQYPDFPDSKRIYNKYEWLDEFID